MTGDIEPTDPGRSPLPFEDLDAPQPLDASPPAAARWIAFALIVVGGLLGGMVGYGIGDVMGATTTWAATGAVAGAATGAIGVGVVANLTLRAMNEWQATQHPEQGGSGRRGRDRHWTRRAS